jgi:predicted MFS family arabinose efflux permease
VLTPYLALLRLPGAARLVVAALVGRLPLAMVPLAAILLLRSEHRSFAVAGGVAAAEAIGAGVAAIPQGRLVDRLGQQRVLLSFAAVYASATIALLVAARAGAAPALLVALGALIGASIPPLSASMRVLWPVLTGGDDVETAFALEAVLQEAFWITGPLLVGALAAFASPAAALLTAAALALAGTTAFATAPLSRAQRGGSSGAGRLGALAAPGLRTIMLALLPFGMAAGAVEVTLPAFAEDHGSRALAGVFIALLGVGSMAAGLWYGHRRFGGPIERRYAAVLALFALAIAPLTLPASNGAMAVAAVIAGIPFAPVFSTTFTLIERLAPPGALTESYTLFTTAIVFGVAAGNAAGGALVEPLGTRWTFAAAAGVAALAPLVALARVRTLAAHVPAP